MWFTSEKSAEEVQTEITETVIVFVEVAVGVESNPGKLVCKYSRLRNNLNGSFSLHFLKLLPPTLSLMISRTGFDL